MTIDDIARSYKLSIKKGIGKNNIVVGAGKLLESFTLYISPWENSV